MAKNDTILIDGILDDRVAEHLPSDRRDEAFEFFAFEQILRDADLSREELDAGWVDGQDDGGIDGFYILVNGHVLIEPESFIWPRSGCELDVWIITCKHRDTFKQAPVDNLAASVAELLDFSIPNDALKGAYSEQLVKVRTSLMFAYRKVSPRLTHFSMNFAYASRGDASIVGSSILARANQVISIVNSLFGNCNSTFKFIGATELITIQRKVRMFSLEIPFLEALTRGERYVLLCRLADFNRFVIDDAKKLRRYLFDSNVRAFMGLNRVNEDIRDTLAAPESPDFWWLNNGITILANNATVTGKSIQLEGVQIVNGLQTTESIARYFSTGGTDAQDRAVLVKIIVSTDASIRDAIIRATNNQTTVELSSLHATDKIQRDIEDVLLRNGYFYERRTNFYTSQGHPADRIITPLYLAAGYVSLVMKRPTVAVSLRSRFMRVDETYNTVFSQAAPLKVWPAIASIMKKTDAVLETLRPVGTFANERFLKRQRHMTAFISIARLFGRFTFSAGELANLNLDDVTDELLISTWKLSQSISGFHSFSKQGNPWKFVRAVCEATAVKHGISGIEAVEQRLPRPAPGSVDLSAAFLDQVNTALPEQPWKPGVHQQVATALGCRSALVYEAIQQLVANGTRHQQKDGVVYGLDGQIIAIDETRVDIEASKEGS